MKKILLFLLPVLLLTSCVDSLDDYNIDQKRASAVPAATLFSNAVRNLSDILTTPNVNSNNFRLYTQYWTTTTYLDEPRYSMVSRTYSQAFWQALYRDVLADLKEAKRLLNEDATVVADVKQNQLAQIEIVEVMAWSTLVNTFGNVPYSQALDPQQPLPAYDDARTIYNDLATRLDAALANIKTGATGFSSTADLLYAGRVANWVKFGNSLKLRLGMTLADVDAAKAKTMVEQATPNVFTSNSDNARFAYQGALPNNNPISSNLSSQFTTRQDFVVAETIVNPMNDLSDPRRPFYFTQINGRYVGGRYGFSNTYANFSKVSDKILAASFEALLLDYSEVEFLLAEAVERSFITSGTAADHYNKAVTASITYWGGTAADASTYLAQPTVAYATATGNYKQKIGFQKWIALYNRGWDAWVEWRRLDYPALKPPTGDGVPALSIPVRMVYPQSEQTQNTDSYNAASSAIGGDLITTKLFWDKN